LRGRGRHPNAQEPTLNPHLPLDLTRGVGFLAKDPWNPAMRREQMIARHLVRRGLPVRFVQAPADVRRLRTDPGNWWRHLRRARFQTVAPGITVTERSTLQPGLRHGLAERTDAGLLGSFLRRSGWDPALSVFMLPWEWRASRGLGGRVVFDCTDDWARVLPHARGLPAQLRRIADEADEIVVVNQVLADLFPGRSPVVVPNGTDETLLTAPQTAERVERHAVYVGSISERFDVDLVRAVLAALPDWTLTVHGQLVFPLRAQAAQERFLALQQETGGRFRYEGLISRERLPEVLDAAAVALIPDVASIAWGQSSMKTYDYCARGVPVIATAGHLEHSSDVPPYTYVVQDAEEMAAAMVAAADEPVSHAKERVGWAAERTWDRRTDSWLDAALGDRPADVTGVQSSTTS
jgi:glycosyltransferase involved in cell wall biosynthesis